VKEKVANEVAAAVGVAVAAVATGIVAALIAAIVLFAVLEFFEWLKTVWEDDPFPPQTVSVSIDKASAATFDNVADDFWAPLNFIGHGGHYQVMYSHRCCS
jgi:hypothetical protein